MEIRNENNTTLEINALTCIDPVTNIVELVRINNKTSEHVAQKFEDTWLSRYPWPVRCIHDNGGEFIGAPFQLLLQKSNIQDKPTTSKNPQANAVCERMHQTVGNMLRTHLHGNEYVNEETANNIVDHALATTMHATRIAVSRHLGNNSPGAIAFHRDMFLNIPFEADLLAVQERRQLLIDRNLERQNAQRRHFDYQPGQQVLVKVNDPTKLGVRTVGPFHIEQVHTNGTITIRRSENLIERINIRRIIPFRQN